MEYAYPYRHPAQYYNYNGPVKPPRWVNKHERVLGINTGGGAKPLPRQKPKKSWNKGLLGGTARPQPPKKKARKGKKSSKGFCVIIVRMRMRMRYGCAGFFVNLMAWNVETPFDSHLIAVLTPANMV
ncbi:hypothetical protein MMC10_011054 [Thelotrema lepadinum]|nr:hypothetical protein [Thelotrema lepadinum]